MYNLFAVRLFSRVVSKIQVGSYSLKKGDPNNCSLSPKFKQVLESDNFVDKSELILAICNKKERIVLCTAPRRFGKTVNLNMIQRFLELEVDENGKEKTTVLAEKDNYKLFNSGKAEKLKVMAHEKFVQTHFGQYPIIKIDFFSDYDIKKQSDAVNVCRKALWQAYVQHEYLYTSKLSPLEDEEKTICEQWCDPIDYEKIPDGDVMNGLENLAVYLNKFHKKQVFLLVDEYDSIISNALYHMRLADPQLELQELEQIAIFPIRVIGNALKRFSDIFGGAYITGILDIAGIEISTVLGNVLRWQFGRSNECQDFYGFTKDEVLTLFERFNVKGELQKKAMAKYNGYINGKKQPLYNPQSVVRFLENLKHGEDALQNYWVQSGYIKDMYKLFQKDEVRRLLHKLLQGATDLDLDFHLDPLELSDLKSLHSLLSHSNLTYDKTIVIKFLVYLGYLTCSLDDRKVQIPNSEVIEEINKRLRQYFFEIYGIDSELASNCSRTFSKLVNLCDEDDSLAKFKKELANFQKTITDLLQKSKIITPINKATLQGIISSACSQKGFLFGNDIIIPIYNTRLDISLFNDKSGIIVELKRSPQTEEDALKQIFKNHYYNVFTMEKYFNERQKAPLLSLVIGLQIDSEKKASVMCLRKKDISEILDDLKIEATLSLENRIEIGVKSMGDPLIQIFCEKAIRASTKEEKPKIAA